MVEPLQAGNDRFSANFAGIKGYGISLAVIIVAKDGGAVCLYNQGLRSRSLETSIGLGKRCDCAVCGTLGTSLSADHTHEPSFCR